MWSKRTNTLTPLTKLFSTKVKIKWTNEENNHFTAIKKIVGRDVLRSYPNLNKNLIINTDTRNTQLGGIISLNGKPITFN